MKEPSRNWLWHRLLNWWQDGSRRDYSWRHASDPFHVLLAEMLLQRTRADAVDAVWPVVIRRWPSADDLAAADDEELDQVTASLGLAWRSRNLKRMARDLIVRHGGRVPHDDASLRQLAGVGPYAATATRVMAFHDLELVADSNVVRVFSRVLGFEPDPETRRRRWFLERIRPFVPRSRSREANLALLDFAARVCTVRQPSCHTCPLVSRCHFGRARVPAG